MITYNDNLSYEILEDGYKIYLNGNLWIEQIEPYGKVYDRNKSYEENCLMQLEELTRASEPVPDEKEERIAALEEQNQMLTECILEMADIIYA